MFRRGVNTVCSAYQRRLEQRPLQTKMLTSAALFSLGDFICQKSEAAICSDREKKDNLNDSPYQNGSLTSNWDSSRTLRQGMIGGFLLSPGLHLFLTRVMSRVNFPSLSRTSNIGIRVGVHQACMMPFIQFTLLFVSAAMQPAPTANDRIAAGKKRFSDKWRTGFTASLMYWPIVNSVMYAVVKPRFMNLYADVASLCFASVMSYITYRDDSSLAVFTETLDRPRALLPSFTDASMPSNIFTEAASTLPLIWQSHLINLMNNGTKVEAQAEVRDSSWLLSTQT